MRRQDAREGCFQLRSQASLLQFSALCWENRQHVRVKMVEGNSSTVIRNRHWRSYLSASISWIFPLLPTRSRIYWQSWTSKKQSWILSNSRQEIASPFKISWSRDRMVGWIWQVKYCNCSCHSSGWAYNRLKRCAMRMAWIDPCSGTVKKVLEGRHDVVVV